MKKVIRRVLAGFGIFLIVLLGALIALFRQELGTLLSLKKAGAYPLYSMTYTGDYGFSDFLKVGAQSDREIERFVIKRLLKGLDIDLNIAGGACSAFTSQNAQRQRLYARNFDFDFAPALVLKTQPKDGYASISTVNLAFAGYGEKYLPAPLAPSSFFTLAAPYLPFDGMNERGVVIALLAVPHAEPPMADGKVTLNTTTMIRLILDRAANVGEAVSLIKGHTLYFSGGVECHYLISDAAGNSAVVEFLDHDVKVTYPDKNYQLTTNYIMFEGRNEGEGGSEFERYDTIDKALAASGGVISDGDAMALLAKAVIPDRTQWSVVYNQSTGEVRICAGAKYDKVYSYHLDMK